MVKNIFYLKFDKTRLNILDDGIEISSDDILLTFINDEYSISMLESLFSNLEEGLTIYSCILQEDGSETDEFIASHYDNYTKLDTITLNEDNTYTVKLINDTTELNNSK